MKEKILNVIISVIALVLVILCVLFKEEYKYLLISLSSLGSILGICFILKKANYGYLILAMSLSLLLSTIMYYCKVLDFGDTVTLFIASSVGLLMILSLIFDFINKRIINNIYSLIVNARVVDLEKNNNVKKECYAPVYEYDVDNLTYEIVAPYYLDKNIPNIGDNLVIRVNPSEPEQVYFNKSIIEEIKEKGVALVLIIVCILIIVGLF